MLMVCVVHVAGAAGLRWDDGGVEQMIARIWAAFSIIAVNLYAMLTGYLCVNRRWNIKRYIELWFVVVFYTMSLFLIPVVMGESVYSVYGVRSTFLRCNPMTCSYWYFVAYSGVYAVMPFLNKGLNALDAKSFKVLVFVLLFSFSALAFWEPGNTVQHGYNVFWLMIMYIVGAYVKLYKPVVNKIVLIIIYFVCCLVNFVALVEHGSMENMFFYAYPSISTVGASIAFFLLIMRLRIKYEWMKCLLRLGAPMAFAVYLIHDHPYVRQVVKKSVAVYGEMCEYRWWYIPICALCIYVVCSFVDRIRISIFKWLKMSEIAAFIASKFPSQIRDLDK